jgi:solute carrier family 25 (mitochondrial folate transporter), member 32
MAHGVRAIWRDEGVRGFWRGMVPGLIGVSHGAVQIACYEKVKEWRRHGDAGMGEEGGQGQRELGNADFLLASATSKVAAGVVTYPCQVIRVRLQGYEAETTYRGAWDAVVQTWTREGVRGFYKGLAPSIVRVLPSTCVTFLVYENVRWYLGSKAV